MKKIKLTQGKFALVDDEDFERVNKLKWYASFHPKRNVFTSIRRIGNKTIYMHQFIMNTISKGHNYSIDHMDHDPLNNQKSNLRVCNNSENMRNRGRQKNNKSGAKGVCYVSERGKFKSYIKLNNKLMHLGYYNTLQEAALAYNKKALELFGEFAYLNKIEGI